MNILLQHGLNRFSLHLIFPIKDLPEEEVNQIEQEEKKEPEEEKETKKESKETKKKPTKKDKKKEGEEEVSLDDIAGILGAK